jgi:hypothetical protein
VKKYGLRPGWVTSKTDGDRHWVSAEQLARLYQVPMDECVMAPHPTEYQLVRDRFWKVYGYLPTLAPRFDGDYRIFKDPS